MADNNELVAKHPKDFAAIDKTASLFEKYASHGRSAEQVFLVTRPVDMPTDQSPVAVIAPNGACIIVNISDDYSKVTAAQVGSDSLLSTPEMRAMVLAHEDMHCRIGAADFRDTPDTGIATLGQMYDQLSNESIADSMAILTTARRDGPDAALSLIDQVRTLRDAGAAAGDQEHDTRKSLELLADVIKNQPEKYASDAAAFTTAIETGIKGATATFPGQINDAERPQLQRPEFTAVLEQQADRLAKSVKDYTDGPYLHTPKTIETLNGAQRTYPDRTPSMGDRMKEAFEAKGKDPDALRDSVRSMQKDMQHGAQQGGKDTNQVRADHPYLVGRRGEAPALQLEQQRAPELAKEPEKSVGMRM